jgi:AcrR family transcriptional regulator
MQEICAAAGMSPGALYRYFPSKEAIIAAIAEAERERNAQFFEELARAADPVEALGAIAYELLRQTAESGEAAITAETIAEAIRNPAIRALIERNLGEARAALKAALARGQQCGLVDRDLDLDTTVRMLIAFGDGLCAHRALDPSLELDRVAPVVATLLRRFLRPPAPTAGGAS